MVAPGDTVPLRLHATLQLPPATPGENVYTCLSVGTVLTVCRTLLLTTVEQ